MGKLLDIALGAAAIGGGVWAMSKIKHGGGAPKPGALTRQSATTSVPRTFSFGPIRLSHALLGGGSPAPAPSTFSGDGVSPPPTNIGGDLSSGGGSLDANQILGDANAAVGLVGTVGNLVNSFGGGGSVDDPSSDPSAGFDASASDGGIDYTGQGDPGAGY